MSHPSFDATIKYSEAAIRGLFLLNGGACLALLTFIGSLANKEQIIGADLDFSRALILFAIGALLAVLVSAASYISQGHDSKNNAIAFNLWRGFSIFIYLVSVLLFLLGVYIVERNFSLMGI